MSRIVWALLALVATLSVTSNATQRASTQAETDKPRTACLSHGHQPGGSAVDINEVNGKPVSLYGKDADVTRAVNNLQAAANRSGASEQGAATENYGPAGLWRNGKLVRDAELQNHFRDHIHILPPEERKPE